MLPKLHEHVIQRLLLGGEGAERRLDGPCAFTGEVHGPVRLPALEHDRILAEGALVEEAGVDEALIVDDGLELAAIHQCPLLVISHDRSEMWRFERAAALAWSASI